MNDESMKKPDEMRTEYRRACLDKGVRGKHRVGQDGKSMLPVVAEGTEPFLAAVEEALSDDFPDEITDDDLGTDVPRREMDW